MDAFATWPDLAPPEVFTAVTAAAEAAQRRSSAAIGAVSEQESALREKFSALAAEEEGLRQSVTHEKQRISEAVAEFTTNSVDQISEVKKAWSEARDEQAEAAQTTLDRLNELESQAQKVVHATTAKLVATDYGRYARNKSISAWVCDIVAGFVGLAGVAVMVHHLLGIDPGEDANVGLALTRAAVSIGTLGIAGLIGRRGNQHHKEARAAKRTELALCQVRPFTANLEESEQQRIVQEITKRIFIDGDLDSQREQVGLSRILGRTSNEEKSPA